MRTQLLEQFPSLENELGYTPGTIEVYVNGVAHMYTGPFYGSPGVGGTFDKGPSLGPIGNSPGSPWGVISRPDYLEGGIERFRAPETDEAHGSHMNYEILLPCIGAILNIHIPMDAE